MIVDQLVVIKANYHVYTHVFYRLSLEEVLRTAKMEVPPANYMEESWSLTRPSVGVGLMSPLSKFLQQLCEGWAVCLDQLAPNAFTVINAFCVASHLVKEDPLPEVFSQFYKLTRPRNQFLYSPSLDVSPSVKILGDRGSIISSSCSVMTLKGS